MVKVPEDFHSQDNLCLIYEQRPQASSSYLHPDVPEMKFRWNHIADDYKICPIVYNTVEKLNITSGFLETGKQN